jgi:hypothetical protein
MLSQGQEPPIDKHLIAQLSGFPESLLVVKDVTEEEKMIIEEENSIRYNFPKTKKLNAGDVIAAYEVSSPNHYAFYPLRIIVTTESEFPDPIAVEFWGRFKEVPLHSRDHVNYKKPVALFRQFDDGGGIDYGIYWNERIKTPSIGSDNVVYTEMFSNTPAFVLDAHVKKEKISIRIVQLFHFRRFDQSVPLVLVKGGEKYYDSWHEIRFINIEGEKSLIEKIDFDHFFTTLNKSILKNIRNSDILEKHRASLNKHENSH